jgi:hypothetical protein
MLGIRPRRKKSFERTTFREEKGSGVLFRLVFSLNRLPTPFFSSLSSLCVGSLAALTRGKR